MAYNLTADEVYNDGLWFDVDDEPEVICICADHIGTDNIAWCDVHGDYTDNIEIKMQEAAENAAGYCAWMPNITPEQARLMMMTRKPMGVAPIAAVVEVA